MIAFITGTIHHLQDGAVVVLTGGIGYAVAIPQRTQQSLHVGDTVSFYTYQHVREDVLALYGFESVSEMQFFKQLLQVSGIGPRIALTALSQHSALEIQRAIIRADKTFLTGISGIGKKTAERIILDLKDSLAVLEGETNNSAPSQEQELSAIDALISLGYSRVEAMAALKEVDQSLSLEEQVRQALRRASRV
ncbi:MAG TPA: Holliday junction branch migration protein RuvA [Patescibacteria group bacterium]|nr:Holliday junction branch migration protein RuvA [Patescibacteria group bacterium]